MLLSSGHDLDRLIDRYTFDQLGLQARCILQSRADMLNAVVGPLVGIAGGTWKGHAAKGGQSTGRTRRSFSRPGHKSFAMGDHGDTEAKERGLLNAFARAGVRVRGVASGGGGGTEGTG